MGKRGVRPRRTEDILWSAKIAYAVGLITTDGCLSPDGRHIILVSKDIEQLQNFIDILGLQAKIGTTISGYTGKPTTRIQFGDIRLYNFLLQAGLMPNKTKIVGSVHVPDEYFFDFLRGHFDGDGSFYSYWDPRWRSSFMYYLTFVSASKPHIDWLQKSINRLLGVQGHITKDGRHITHQLKYAKKEALLIIGAMYKDSKCVHLRRKHKKILLALKEDKEAAIDHK